MRRDGLYDGTVNSAAPSLIGTDMVPAGLSASLSRIPVGRFGTSGEVAHVVLMLIGNGYMTGQTLALSGGMSFNQITGRYYQIRHRSAG
jgi:3-oxoacyl-[acyl-carrier protein] reductase